MPLIITDEQLKVMQMDEPNARIEIACRLFDANKLSLPAASKLAGMGRAEFEGQLRLRGIAIYRPTIEDVKHDLEALRRLGT